METNLISVAEAVAILDATDVSPRVLEIDLHQAQELRLAHDITADRDYPPFDKSLMDGFAVRSADVPGTLQVIGEIAAGARADRPIGPGQAMAIMTGAPLPEGADAVVPIEDCDVISPSPGTPGDGRGEGPGISNINSQKEESPHPDPLPAYRAREVGIRVSTQPGRNIARQGADCAAGTVVLQRGTKLDAAQLAVAASVGAHTVQVFGAPRVAVLSTGDELVDISKTPGPSQIRNSNNIMLVALMKNMGCDVVDQGVVRDDPDLIRRAIAEAMQFDILFITGGMSMGRYDFVPKILLDLGVELKITKLRIKPGKPFIFGVKPGSAHVFGLPGNPVSSFVCALRLCGRLIGRMQGADSIQRWSDAKLESPVQANGTREFYQPAILAGSSVQPLKWNGSADIYTLARANALIVRPENSPALSAGSSVRVLEIPS